MSRFVLFFFFSISQLFVVTTSFSKEVHINKSQILKNEPNINPVALNYAIKGYRWALKQGNIDKPQLLTLIDFTKPSNQKRLWVINLVTNEILMNAYTTHGKNSGLNVASSFSNRHKTKKTSLGVFKTMNSYHGKHGFSLRIKGLEKGINDNALGRAIVFHPAYYATDSFVKKYNRTGRSWGCFALSPKLSKQFVNTTKNGSIVVAYAKPVKNDPYIAKA